MMKTLVLTLVLLLSFGNAAMAASHQDDYAEFDVTLSVADYVAVENITDDVPYITGLFGGGDELSGEPGIYVSDGSATLNYAQNISAWNDDFDWDYQYMGEWDRTNPEYEGTVEKFKIQANTHVLATLEWTDQDGWPNLPTIFRISSSTDMGTDGLMDESDRRGRGRGDWGDDLAVVANTLDVGGEYEDLHQAHNDNVANAESSIHVAFEQSGGPVLFHINSALLIPKSDSVESGDYDTTLRVTVAAADGVEGGELR